MTPLNLPASPVPANLTITAAAVVGRTTSIYTGRSQTYAHIGSWWSLVMQMPTMSHEEAGAWVGFLSSLHGSYQTFLAGPVLANRSFNFYGGLVNGANQTGNSLISDGWPINALILKTGDFISIGYRLYQATADVYSTAAGAATIGLWPKLRAHADNSAIETADPRGQFRINGNEQAWSIDEMKSHGVTINAIEAL